MGVISTNTATLYAIILNTVGTITFLVGVIFGYIQLREYYKLRKLQVLSSFNERLGKCRMAHEFISNPKGDWAALPPDIKI
jgi:uncharacterized membrane protein